MGEVASNDGVEVGKGGASVVQEVGADAVDFVVFYGLSWGAV